MAYASREYRYLRLNDFIEKLLAYYDFHGIYKTQEEQTRFVDAFFKKNPSVKITMTH